MLLVKHGPVSNHSSFSRQEEIDLVVFVVSAENHFTLSAKEFIAAANEKGTCLLLSIDLIISRIKKSVKEEFWIKSRAYLRILIRMPKNLFIL